jgi:hypothetical protein
VLNTIIGLIISCYEPLNYLLADLSLALSTGIIYGVICSKVTNGFKIGLTSLFFITGIIRCLCVALASTTLANNISYIVAVAILFFEIICLSTSVMISNK